MNLSFIVFSSICAIIQIAVWWIYNCKTVKSLVDKKYGEKSGNLAHNILKTLVVFLPAVLCIKYFAPYSVFFILGSIIADAFILECVPVGALMYLIVYSISSLFVIVSVPQVAVYWAVATVIILTLLIILFTNWHAAIIEKIGATTYGFIALLLCTVAFCYSRNFGFLCLVVADALLIAVEIVRDRAEEKVDLVMNISNTFYYLGVSFVPIALYLLQK